MVIKGIDGIIDLSIVKIKQYSVKFYFYLWVCLIRIVDCWSAVTSGKVYIIYKIKNKYLIMIFQGKILNI